MPTLTFSLSITFTYELNASLQQGDDVYWNSLAISGGFSHKGASNVVMHIGTITLLNRETKTITISSPHTDTDGNPLPNVIPTTVNGMEPFISFSKNNVVNNNDLTGYYTSVQFSNNSKVKAELFSVGSEVSESSK
jgi:hypothetical protein